jgi:hypothetical protein
MAMNVAIEVAGHDGQRATQAYNACHPALTPRRAALPLHRWLVDTIQRA